MQHQGHHQINIAAVSHRHHGRLPDLRIGQRQVLDTAADEHLIRNNRLTPGERENHAVTGIDAGDAAFKIVQPHVVTNAQAALRQYDKTADVTCREFLQAKPQPDPQGAAQHRQRGEVHAKRRQCEQQPNEHQQGPCCIAQGQTQRQLATAGRAQQPGLNHRRNPERQHQHQGSSQAALYEGSKRHAGLAHFPADLVQLIEQQWQQAADPQHHGAPGQPGNAAL